MRNFLAFVVGVLVAFILGAILGASGLIGMRPNTDHTIMTPALNTEVLSVTPTVTRRVPTKVPTAEGGQVQNMKFGDTINMDGVELTVVDTAYVEDRWVTNIKINNQSGEVFGISLFQFTMQDMEGGQYQVATCDTKFPMVDGDVLPGYKRNGSVCIKGPDNSPTLSVVYKPDFLGGDAYYVWSK